MTIPWPYLAVLTIAVIAAIVANQWWNDNVDNDDDDE